MENDKDPRPDNPPTHLSFCGILLNGKSVASAVKKYDRLLSDKNASLEIGTSRNPDVEDIHLDTSGLTQISASLLVKSRCAKASNDLPYISPELFAPGAGGRDMSPLSFANMVTDNAYYYHSI